MGNNVFYLFALGFVLPLLPAQMQAQVGQTVKQVTLQNSQKEAVQIPYLGEKHLLVWYVDPDRSGMNSDFQEHMESNPINSDNIYSFGVVNLEDTVLPNFAIRSVINGKVKKTGATILLDPNHALRDGWNLGDVNGGFCIIFVNKDLEILFFSKSELTEDQRAEILQIIEDHR